jgi:ABC-type transport system involved in multi-copper enzyme maturation permease subunit
LRQVLHLAAREWLEQRRQPWMLLSIATLYGLVAGTAALGIFVLQYLHDRPDGTELLTLWLHTSPAALAGSLLALFDFLAFTQFLGIAAVSCGHALLHDRQCGTLTFLLLAPTGRVTLLLGKVLGALGWPLVLYWLLSGCAAALMSLAPITAGHPQYLPRSASFLVAFGLGCPLWALWLGTGCALLSAVARDVRTAQQGVWFAVFFTSLLAGSLLTWGLEAGVLAELAVAGLAGSGAAGALTVGSALLTRDLGR